MAKFVARLGVFLLLGWTLAAALSLISQKWPPNYAHVREVGRIQSIIKEQDILEVLALGNSHARAFDWSSMGVEGRDLGLAWNDAFGIEYHARTIAADLPRLHTVLIAVTPITFMWDNSLAGEETYLFNRRLFHAATRYRGFVAGDWRSFVRGQVHWLVREDYWYRVLLGIARRDPYRAERHRHLRFRSDPMSSSLLREHAEVRVASKTALQDAMADQNGNLAEDAYRALSAGIRELQERKVRVILFTPPYYHKYVEEYSEHEAWARMDQLARRFAKEHGVDWFDFSDDPLSRDPANFSDSDHLNYRGRVLFTQRFQETLCGGPLRQGRPYASSWSVEFGPDERHGSPRPGDQWRASTPPDDFCSSHS